MDLSVSQSLQEITHRTLKASLFVLICSLFIAGCDHPQVENPEPGPETKTARSLRIIAQSPAIAELLFQIGAGDVVVGVANHCTEPQAVKDLPKTGGIRANLEVVLDLQPTHILAQSQNEKLEDYARSAKVQFQRLRIETYDDVKAQLVVLGELTGHQQQARAEQQRLERERERLRAEFLAQRPSMKPDMKQPKKSLKVLLCLSRGAGSLKQVMTCSMGFLSESLDLFQVKNAFADVKAPYPSLNLEEIMDRDPDIILEVQGQDLTDSERQALIQDWQALGQLSAVKNKRIRVIGGTECLLPGPRLPLFWGKLQRALLSLTAPKNHAVTEKG